MLVENSLAACVQILPAIESVYRWKGSVERSSEVLLIAKTESGKFPELERQVRAMHSYEVPEIVALPPARFPNLMVNGFPPVLIVRESD